MLYAAADPIAFLDVLFGPSYDIVENLSRHTAEVSQLAEHIVVSTPVQTEALNLAYRIIKGQQAETYEFQKRATGLSEYRRPDPTTFLEHLEDNKFVEELSAGIQSIVEDEDPFREEDGKCNFLLNIFGKIFLGSISLI